MAGCIGRGGRAGLEGREPSIGCWVTASRKNRMHQTQGMEELPRKNRSWKHRTRLRETEGDGQPRDETVEFDAGVEDRLEAVRE